MTWARRRSPPARNRVLGPAAVDLDVPRAAHQHATVLGHASSLTPQHALPDVLHGDGHALAGSVDDAAHRLGLDCLHGAVHRRERPGVELTLEVVKPDRPHVGPVEVGRGHHQHRRVFLHPDEHAHRVVLEERQIVDAVLAEGLDSVRGLRAVREVVGEDQELLLGHVGEHRGHLALDLDHQAGLALVTALDAPDVRANLEGLAKVLPVHVQNIVEQLVLGLILTVPSAITRSTMPVRFLGVALDTTTWSPGRNTWSALADLSPNDAANASRLASVVDLPAPTSPRSSPAASSPAVYLCSS